MIEPDTLTTLLNFSERFAVFCASMMLHSTVIIAAGLLGKRLFSKCGAALQSIILHGCLIAVLLCPVSHLILNIIRLNGYTIPLTFVTTKEPVLQVSADKHPFTNPIEIYSPRQNVLSENVLQETIKTIVIPGTDYPVEMPDQASDTDKNETNIPDRYIHQGIERTTQTDVSVFLKLFRYRSMLLHLCLSTYLPLFVTSVWLSLSAYPLIKCFAALINLWLIRRSAFPAHFHFYELCRDSAAKLGVQVPPILQSPSVRGIFLADGLKPSIFLPYSQDTATIANSEVFIHELAHFKRHDNVWNLLYQLGKILYPVQPLLRILNNQIKESGDYVCDDYVLRAPLILPNKAIIYSQSV